MHFSHIFLGLAATASAIDVYGYRSNEQCKGGDYIVYRNANPNDCVISASGNVYRSIQIRAIPNTWNVRGQAFVGGQCSNVRFRVDSNGNENICLGGNNYSGGNYVFASKKLSEGSTEQACLAGNGCGSTARAGLLVFEDGSVYDLTALPDSLYYELVRATYIQTPFLYYGIVLTQYLFSSKLHSLGDLIIYRIDSAPVSNVFIANLLIIV